MVFRWIFIIYIASITAFDGYLDQSAHDIKDESVAVEADSIAGSSSQVEVPHHDDKNDDCPDPESCHSCHHCMSHCGFLSSSVSIKPTFLVSSTFGEYFKKLVSRELDSLFRPPIAA